MPEFFRETHFSHFTKVKWDFTLVKCPSLLEEGEEYKEGTTTYSRACARDNGPLGNKKFRAKAHAVKRQLQRLHWDNCKVRFDEAVAFSFVASALTAGFLETDIIAAYDRALHEIMVALRTARPHGTTDLPWATPGSCSPRPHDASTLARLIPRSPA